MTDAHDPSARRFALRNPTSHRKMVRRMVAPVVWVALATLITPSAVSAQATGTFSTSGPSTFLNSLSLDAQRADSPAGDLNYATELIRMMASHVSRGDVAQLARRIATADQAARHDPSKYIPEGVVAVAFNGLMAQVLDKSATAIRTDTQTVHRMRGVLAANAPALTSIKEHPASCLPDEAVLLMFELKFSNGRVVIVPRGQPLPPVATSERVEDGAEDAGLRLDRYLAAHSAATNMALFSRMLTDMGIQP